MASFHYGGQALIEGVLMRGRNALAVALRHPDGYIVWAVERLDMGVRARRGLKLPFFRGLVVLYDTLVTGTRWLVRSATLQAMAIEAGGDQPGSRPGGTTGAAPGAGAGSVVTALRSLVLAPAALIVGAISAHEGVYSDPDSTGPGASGDGSGGPGSDGMGKGYTVALGAMMLVTMAFAVGIFFLLPLLIAQATVGRVDQGLGYQLTEGLIRVAIFIAYLLLVARQPDVRRTFQYHGAEHMSIHTLEGGDSLTVEAARKYPTAHPRCGTEFLVVVMIVSILTFALIGQLPPLYLIVSRVLLIPVIAAISYEILQLGARHRSHAFVRWLWSPGIAVQMITTKQPTDDMIEVAIVSLQQALVSNGDTIPAGSSEFDCRPLDPAPALLAVSAAQTGLGSLAASTISPAPAADRALPTRSPETAATVNPDAPATRSSEGNAKVNSEGVDS